jgi:hypothetical protein
MANQIAQYPMTSGASLPVATAAGQVPTSTGAGTTYTAQTPASGAMTLIQTQTLGSAVSSVTFSSIPQTFKHLMLVFEAVNSSSSAQGLLLTINGDSTAVYNWVIIAAGAVYSGFAANSISAGAVGGASSGRLVFYRYSVSSATLMVEGQGSSFVPGALAYQLSSGAYVPASAATVTSFTLSAPGTFAAGGVFSLYGLS